MIDALVETPDSEAARLKAVRARGILEAPAEPEFHDAVHLAASICAAPVAFVAFLDRDRLWIKARVGPAFPDPPRQFGFCAATVAAREPVIVPDAAADPRAEGNAALDAPLYARFYAGVPLLTLDGHALGTLAVYDHVPRRIEPWQREGLERLARMLSGAIEGRAVRRERDRRRSDAVAALAGSLAAELQLSVSGAPERNRTAQALARQLLAMVGHQSLRPQPLDVNRLLERLATRRSAADGSWQLSLDPEIGPATGDEERIGRAIGGLAAQAAGNNPGGVRIATAGRRVASSDPEPLLPPGEYVMVTIDGRGDGSGHGEGAASRAGAAPGEPLADWCFDPGAVAVLDGDAGRAVLEVSGLMIQSGGRLGVARSRRPAFCLALPRVRAEA
jgi:hypothetical protein